VRLPRPSPRLRGLVSVLIGAALWGLSGTAAQVLFQRHGIQPQWLVAVRMLGAGVLLLALLRPPLPTGHWRRLVVFALAGVATVQYTYFAAIAASNVATATFLQYTSVAMIAGWEVVAGRAHMSALLGLALTAALGGVALVVLGGRSGLGGLALNPVGVVFGLLSAVTAAVYTISSVPLVRAIGPWPTTGWGFLIGSIPMLAWAPPWSVRPNGSLLLVAALTAFVVLFGTLVAFGLFLDSFKSITPTEAAITATAEPVAAALAALFILGVALLPLQYVGGAAILIAVAALRVRRPPEPLPEPPG
jgi:drug/metabolite transporter (DMT)-like permease